MIWDSTKGLSDWCSRLEGEEGGFRKGGAPGGLRTGEAVGGGVRPGVPFHSCLHWARLFLECGIWQLMWVSSELPGR